MKNSHVQLNNKTYQILDAAGKPLPLKDVVALINSLADDAGRYRYLRECSGSSEGYLRAHICSKEDAAGLVHVLSGSDADETIDAEMAHLAATKENSK